jgi:hypothetical protein
MARAGNSANPFSFQTPKPKIVDLINLITARQRTNYRSISRSLKRLPGVHARLIYYGKEWGWALRYQRGDATLCTLHFLPSRFEATITVTPNLEAWGMGANHLSPPTRRSLHSLQRNSQIKMLRMTLGPPHRARDLARMVRHKVQSKQSPGRRRGLPERKAGARARTVRSP